jgi:hypothetical protein
MSAISIFIAIFAALSAYSLIGKLIGAILYEANKSNANFDAFVMSSITAAVLGIALINLLYTPEPTSVYQAFLGLPFAAVSG